MTELWVVPHALPDAFAIEVATFLDVGMPSDWWFRGVSRAEKIPDTDENRIENTARILREDRTAAGGGFAYSFRRTVASHHATCGCQICRTLALFASTQFTKRISETTGISVSTIGHCFASCFTSGDFLSTHTDKDNGELAFVWNLTEADWKPQWGGLLHLLDDSWKNVETTITPSFNTLVLFDVRGNGKPHFVSPVIAGVKEKRLAISGWFS